MEKFTLPSIPKEKFTAKVISLLSKIKTTVKELPQSNADIHSTFLSQKIRKHEIEHLVSSMQIPELNNPNSYWNNIEAKDLDTVIKNLDELLVEYDEVSQSSGVAVSAKEANTAFTLYTIIYHLALLQDLQVNTSNERSPASLKNYPPYFPGLELDKDPYHLCLSPEDYEKRKSLIEYFKQLHLSNPNLGWEYAIDVDMGGYRWKKRGEIPPALFNFASSRQHTFSENIKPTGMAAFLIEILKTHKISTRGTLEDAMVYTPDLSPVSHENASSKKN